MDTRDEIIKLTERLTKTEIFTVKAVLKLIGISRNKYYKWQGRTGRPNHHNANVPKKNWTLPEEKQAVISY
ncbi:hypothetical protein D4R99_03710 [bacterium]|nr:MAG: hypothetical protein D4R99_03710 [bacterium]